MSTSDSRHPAGGAPRRGRSLNSLVVQLSVAGLCFILMAGLVVTSSRAAFVAQNDNTANTVTAAAIDLGDNDLGVAMFGNVTGLMPGTTLYRCIEVTYTGTVDPLPVLLYSSGAPTGTLAPYLNLTVEVGPDSGDSYSSCASFSSAGAVYTGTLATFASTHSAYASGAPTWDPSGSPETRTFRFAVSVQDNAAAEGLTSTFGFSWETRTS